MAMKIQPSHSHSIQPRRGNPSPIKREGDIIHTVRHGDTMSGIARQNNMSLRDLESANPQISNPDRIWAGDQVRVPTMSHADVAPSVSSHANNSFTSTLPCFVTFIINPWLTTFDTPAMLTPIAPKVQNA